MLSVGYLVSAFMIELNRRTVLAGGVSTVVGALAGCLDRATTADHLPMVSQATQYQGPQCACCDVYATYLEEHLPVSLETRIEHDLTGLKRAQGIHRDIWSCHTTVLDGFIVEGHVPVAVIEQAIDDTPSIAGIALPGMPAGSPGMGGEKRDTWQFFAIHTDGSYAHHSER